MVWIEFVICSSLMIFFAYHLCREGIILSKKTRLEEGLIGMFFLALATSFPEVATGSSAVFFLGNIGLGYGDIIGSIIVNSMILLFLDFFQGRGRILFRASRISRLTGIFAVVLLSAVFAAAVLRHRGYPIFAFKGIGLESIVIALMYIGALEVVRRSNRKEDIDIYQTKESFFSIWSKFIALLIIVLLLSMWLAKTGEKIADTTDLSETFTGALFLGFATSFPEMIVSFSALRAGSVDMAVGNIVGSNLFDVFIVPILDSLTRAPILGMLTSGQILITGAVILLSVVTALALYWRRDTTRRINWDTALIFVIGFMVFVLLYYVR
ncbi:MAG: sodium:calcium antiporter [Candidatus Omnitrophota bacterium]